VGLADPQRLGDLPGTVTAMVMLYTGDVLACLGLAVYALGSSVGTLSLLPGGLGANEDISTLVLTHLGVEAGTAEQVIAQRATGGQGLQQLWLDWQVEAYIATGRFEEGWTALEGALTVRPTYGERYWEADLYRLKGTLTLQSTASLGQVQDKFKASQNKSEVPNTHAEAEAERMYFLSHLCALRASHDGVVGQASDDLVDPTAGPWPLALDRVASLPPPPPTRNGAMARERKSIAGVRNSSRAPREGVVRPSADAIPGGSFQFVYCPTRMYPPLRGMFSAPSRRHGARNAARARMGGKPMRQTHSSFSGRTGDPTKTVTIG